MNEVVRIGPFPDSSGLARVVDLSVSGAFVEIRLKPPLMSRIKVMFDVRRGRHLSRCQLSAHVVRSTFGGVGIEWDEASPATVNVLMSMFEFMPANLDQFRDKPIERSQRSN
ncbi:MAG: PilZ domain-containing protein [Gammaproteobacteria bacterium]